MNFRRITRTTMLSLAAAVMWSSTGSGARAATIVNFEPPTYQDGDDVFADSGDGWVRYGTAGAVSNSVYDADNPNNHPVLESSQSLLVTGSGGGYARQWGAAVDEVDDGSTVFALARMTGTNGNSIFFVLHNVATGHSPAAIRLTTDGTFHLWSSGAEITTGISYAADTTYLLEIVLDLTNQQYDAYATALPNGNRISLGTQEFASLPNVPGGGPLTATYLKNNGGIGVRDDSTTVDTMWDAFTVIPEPASLALLGLGVLAAPPRRRTA